MTVSEIKEVIASKANINLQDKYGQTAFMQADLRLSVLRKITEIPRVAICSKKTARCNVRRQNSFGRHIVGIWSPHFNSELSSFMRYFGNIRHKQPLFA